MTPKTTSSWALLARLFLCVIFLVSGLSKLVNVGQTAQYIASQGLPAAGLLAVIAGCIEVIGGLSLLLGLGTTVGGALLFLYLIPVTLVFHDFWNLTGAEQQMQFVQFMKNLAVMGGLLYTAAFGAGQFSVDARLAARAKLPGWWPRPPATTE